MTVYKAKAWCTYILETFDPFLPFFELFLFISQTITHHFERGRLAFYFEWLGQWRHHFLLFWLLLSFIDQWVISLLRLEFDPFITFRERILSRLGQSQKLKRKPTKSKNHTQPPCFGKWASLSLRRSTGSSIGRMLRKFGTFFQMLEIRSRFC